MNHFVCCDISNNIYADKFGFTDYEIDRILSYRIKIFLLLLRIFGAE